MLIGIATVKENFTAPWVGDNDIDVYHNVPNVGVVKAYQKIYRDFYNSNFSSKIIAYIHDDVDIYEPGWDLRVEAEFADPTVGVVGFGGALLHGLPTLYKRPYHISQLGRRQYLSNTRDAEEHGERFTGAREVAVLDGFCLIVRRELLDKCGGWDPDNWPPHHIYDYRICAEAHRHGYRCRVVGIDCHHHGGRTATSANYQEWAMQTKWGSDAEMHAQGHKLFYERYKDVMPWSCE